MSVNQQSSSATYRSNTPTVDSSSEADSDNAEEDTPLWRHKQQKYFRKQQGSAIVVSSSPTLPELKKDGDQVDSAQAGNLPRKKKSNNVWGSVLQEQDLTQTLVKSAGVETKNEADYTKRDVESYDFTKKYQDTRPHIDDIDTVEVKTTDQDLFEATPAVSSSAIAGRSIIDYEDTIDDSKQGRRGRKRKAEDQSDRYKKTGGIHDRLGVKKVTTTHLGDIDVNEDMEPAEAVKKIAEFLHEAKVELIERVVEEMGLAVAIRILQATKDVEEGGGMYTMDGSRRRTPGGVYIQLMKQQPEFTNTVRNAVFREDIQERNKMRNEKRRKNKKRRRSKKKTENSAGSNDNQSRSRSNSYSRSRSPKTKGNNSGEEEMDDGQVKVTENQENRNDSGENRQRNKHRSRSGRHRKTKYNDFDKVDDDNDNSSASDDDDENDEKSSKPLSFEEELAAARKQLEEKAKALESAKTGEMLGEDACEGMGDLDEVEADIVDVPLEVE